MPLVVPTVQRARRTPEGPLEEYACSDGKVLMDTAPRGNAIVAMRNQLQGRLEARPDKCVAGSKAVNWRQRLPRTAGCRQVRTSAARGI